LIVGASDDLHCSHGGDRSWTDPVTNWTLISGVRLDRDLGGMMQMGKYPARLLSPFVHELVHHWCFHSPLGLALAHMQLRARREALLLAKGEPREGSKLDAVFDLLEDVGRYESAVTLMRPLAEGLALFAEFDLMPGSSIAASLVTRWVAHSFGTPTDETEEVGSDSYLGKLLFRHRLSPDCGNRKSNLLADRFSCDGGGYLPGYFLVKNLWFTLVFEKGCHRLLDKDLYLIFLRSFFYEDLGFVAALLDDSASEIQAIENIAVYFQRRFMALLDTTDADLEEFERFLSSRPPGSQTQLDEIYPLGTDKDLMEVGKRQLCALMSELDFDGEPGTLEEVLKRQDQWTLAQRDLMCVGSFRENVRVNEHGRVLVGRLADSEDAGFDVPLMAVGGLNGIAPTEGDGLVEFFISPSGLYRYCAVSVHGKLVAVLPLSEKFPEVLLEQIKGYQSDSEAAMKQKRLIQEIIEEFLSQEGVEDILAHYRTDVARISNAFYDSRSLLRTPDDQVKVCAETMRETGLFEVLEQDGDALRALAVASLAASLSAEAEFVRDVLKDRGISAEALLTACARASARHHLPLLKQHGELLVSYV
jgi:hypothetical protein